MTRGHIGHGLDGRRSGIARGGGHQQDGMIVASGKIGQTGDQKSHAQILETMRRSLKQFGQIQALTGCPHPPHRNVGRRGRCCRSVVVVVGSGAAMAWLLVLVDIPRGWIKGIVTNQGMQIGIGNFRFVNKES